MKTKISKHIKKRNEFRYHQFFSIAKNRKLDIQHIFGGKEGIYMITIVLPILQLSVEKYLLN